MPGKAAPIPCPDCGSQMWDNSETKRGKQPDYVCKDRECRKGVWISNTQRNAQQGRAAAAGGSAQKPRGIILDKAMEQCVIAAKAILGEQFKTGSDIPPELVVNVATTMFIARTDNRGIMKVEQQGLIEQQKKAAQAAAERKRLEEQEAMRRAQDEAAAAGAYADPFEGVDDNELPF